MGVTIERSIDPDATRCDPALVRLFDRAVEASGHRIARLVQCMTSVAATMSLLGPIGSLLIRSHGAVGCGPAGFVDPADIAVGTDVLTFVLRALATGTDTRP